MEKMWRSHRETAARTVGAVAQGVFRFGACELDEGRRELRVDGGLRHLEPQVFDVLAYLIHHRDRVVPKTELLDQVWGSRFVSESALTSRIKTARQAVGDTGREQTAIRTVHGRGYRFIAPVEELPGIGAPAGWRRPSPRPDAPGLVGRSSPFDRLRKRFADVAAGTRRTVFVSGEAGIGKTALAEAFVSSLGPDVDVARGRCLEPRGTAEPYLPVFDALNRLCRGPRGNEVIDVLARAAPSWLLQMPSLLSDERLAEVRARSVGASSQRMLRELVDAIEMLAAQRPLVMLLEDLHWADAPTAVVLDWLARRTDPARLLLVGTFRLDRASGDGVAALASGLVAGGHAEELRLHRLDRSEVERLLETWLPGLPPALAVLVHERTAGVPLFVRDLVSSWIDAGVIVADSAGQWTLDDELENLAQAVPPTVQLLVEADLARLPHRDVEVLEAASVAGVEFFSALAAAATGRPDEELETRCTELARRGLFVSADGTEVWADRTVSARFRFLHQLHQQLLYERVPPGRRARYHLAMGDRLEKAYGTEVEEHVGELAVHFERGGDPVRAAEYLRRSAELAMVRGAYPEALGHLDAALRQTERMSPGEVRSRVELTLELLRGSALIVVQGWAAADVEDAYRRAERLCRHLNDPPERHIVTVGLAALTEMRGLHRETQGLLEPHLDAGPPMLAVETYELLACAAFHLGGFEKAIEYARRGVSLHRPDEPNELYARHGVDPAIQCQGWAACASWFLGRSADAFAHLDDADAVAGDQPYAVAGAAVDRAFLHQYRDEGPAVAKWAEAAVELASEHGYPLRLVQGRIMLGWAWAACGRGDDGVAELRAGLDAYQSTGAFVEWPHYLGMLADALLRSGRPREALDQVADAFAALEPGRSYFYEPELHRLRANALLAVGDGAPEHEAQLALRRGLELARALASPPLRLRLLLDYLRLGVEDRHSEGLHREIRETLAAYPEEDRAPDLLRARVL
jgi:DNA-binding winged helix-turn-helix (wHTH) protein/tetratricopeptide (TPR) repeat protein